VKLHLSLKLLVGVGLFTFKRSERLPGVEVDVAEFNCIVDSDYK
jgi:hypothetical protein